MIDYGLALQGVLAAFSLEVLPWVMLAMIGGLIFGLIPGIGGGLLMIILLPMFYTIDPVICLAMVIAIQAVDVTGGSVTSIVVGVPGTALNAATLLDGFPMAKKGEAARAIGAAITASGLGGLFGGIILVLIIPIAYYLVLGFGSAETFLLALVGMGFIAVLSRGSSIKGFIAGGMGVLLSFIGYQGTTAIPRFTFGQLWLYDGIGIIPFLLGIFALPTVIELVVTGKSIAGTALETDWGEVTKGIKDVFRHWKIFFSSSIIGVVIGIIPGIGAAVATFLAYGQAKSMSKHPEEFGQGCIEGVIAPEAANNAKEGGALVPTLAFGIPGSGTMAIVLAAFLVTGITPGPGMLKEHLDLTFTLIATLIFTNVLGAILLLPFVKYVSKICLVPATVLPAPILAIVVFAAYASGLSYMSIVLALTLGVIGYAMMRYDFNRVPAILGFILGEIVEKNAYMTYQIEGLAFLGRTVPIILIVFFLLILLWPQVKRIFARGRGYAG